MDQPAPRQPAPRLPVALPAAARPHRPGGTPADDTELRAWLRLRSELAELHARLEYLKLMVGLGVQRTRR